jgi:hypothetical protein
MIFRMAGPALLVVLLMSFPWLAPSLQERFLSGAPFVLVYFFVVWGLLIALAAALRAEG